MIFAPRGAAKKTAVAVSGLLSLICAAVLVIGLRGCTHSSPLSSAQVGTIQHRSIAESSGIAASRKYPGVYWTHNDQNNDPSIFAISRDGELIAEFPVDADNTDWEDIATDDAGHLYIGNIGNNNSKRETLEVLRIDEPDPHQPSASALPLKVNKTWRLAFPDKPFNCESLFIHNGNGYLISKVTKRRSAGLYLFPLETDEKSTVLREIATLPIHSPVTGADISPDGARMAVVSFTSLDIFDIAGEPARAAEAPAVRLPFNCEHDIEACCFVPGGILATAETREVYFFADQASPATAARSD